VINPTMIAAEISEMMMAATIHTGKAAIWQT
jgi:hypothetical protein